MGYHARHQARHLAIADHTMCDFKFSTTYEERPVWVRMGWNRARQAYFLAIEYADRKEVPVYSSDRDPDVTRYTTVSHYVRKLLTFGLTVPRNALRTLMLAPYRDGTVLATRQGNRLAGTLK